MPHSQLPPTTRRDFLTYSAVGMTAVGLGVIATGMGATLEQPRSLATSLTIDLSGLSEGAEITVRFEGKPFVIRHRTIQEIAVAEADDAADLVDHLARNASLTLDIPATDRNRRASLDGRFIVMSKVCPHLGCIVFGDGSGDFNGYFCTCHGAHFDTSGRVRKGPPVRNLPIPNHKMPDANTLVLLSTQVITEKKLDALIYGPNSG